MGLRAAIAGGTALALLGLLIGAAAASIPASNGTINACYSTTTGALRVIDYPNRHCASGERFIRWNQAAPAAPAALQGSPCPLPGAGTLYLTVDPSTGIVTLQCKTLLKVASAVALSKILLFTSTGTVPNPECDNATTCSLLLPLGWSGAVVQLISSSDFTYTCPGALAQGAGPDVTRTFWQGLCSGFTMSTDRTVTVTAR
jgi:hypothetical protein